MTSLYEQKYKRTQLVLIHAIIALMTFLYKQKYKMSPLEVVSEFNGENVWFNIPLLTTIYKSVVSIISL